MAAGRYCRSPIRGQVCGELDTGGRGTRSVWCCIGLAPDRDVDAHGATRSVPTVVERRTCTRRNEVAQDGEDRDLLRLPRNCNDAPTGWAACGSSVERGGGWSNTKRWARSRSPTRPRGSSRSADRGSDGSWPCCSSTATPWSRSTDWPKRCLPANRRRRRPRRFAATWPASAASSTATATVTPAAATAPGRASSRSRRVTSSRFPTTRSTSLASKQCSRTDVAR